MFFIMKYDFSDKVAIVTGASGGIGSEVVAKFVEAKAKVFALGSNSNKLYELKQRFSEIGDVTTMICNLANKAEIYDTISSIYNETKKIDFAVCNAGITKDNLSIRMKDEDWQSVIDINLTANFIINREVGKIMMKQRSGSVINIASVIGFTGNFGQVNYAASKAGMVGMTKSFAKEFASRGVRFNVVAPGFIETAMTEVLSDQVKQEVLKSIPMSRYGKPEDIANAVMFLSSDDSSYITGTSIHVNGGMFM